MAKMKRIGALLPATNPVVEPDFYSVVPRDVTVHFERMWNGRWGNQPEVPEDADYKVKMTAQEANTVQWVMFGTNQTKMNEDVERGVRSLANVELDVLAYACTGGTWHRGSLAFDREMAGPYRNHHLNAWLKPLLEEAGFEVINAEGQPWMQESMNPRDIDTQEPSVIVDFALTVAKDEADTVFLPGTAWRALEAAEELEQRLGKTVITVNQATIWNALRTAKWTEPVDGYGKLMRSLS